MDELMSELGFKQTKELPVFRKQYNKVDYFEGVPVSKHPVEVVVDVRDERCVFHVFDWSIQSYLSPKDVHKTINKVDSLQSVIEYCKYNSLEFDYGIDWSQVEVPEDEVDD